MRHVSVIKVFQIKWNLYSSACFKFVGPKSKTCIGVDCASNSIKWLPPLDQLPHLKELYVNGLTKLERIDVENRGSSSSIFFPSLQFLRLYNCPNLKGFERCNKKTSDVGSSLSMEDLPTCFSRISELDISGCPSLNCMLLFPELKKLVLHGDGVKSLVEVLKRWTTSSASESTTSSPFSTLSQLEHLQIWMFMEDCAAIVDELAQYLPSLQQLKFFDCKCKSVSSDENDDAMHWQSLKVLRNVHFYNMENLVCLPKGLQYVTTLQHLDIYGCDSLESIPEWMVNLTALQDLSIIRCSELSERCKNNTAED